MREDKQNRGSDADREQRHRNSRSNTIVAMHHRDGDQRGHGLQKQARPLYQINLRLADQYPLPTRVEGVFDCRYDFTLSRFLAFRLWPERKG